MNGAISQPLESAARRVVTVQGWASFCLLLAVPLLIASSLFITFFAHDEWRQAGLACHNLRDFGYEAITHGMRIDGPG